MFLSECLPSQIILAGPGGHGIFSLRNIEPWILQPLWNEKYGRNNRKGSLLLEHFDAEYNNLSHGESNQYDKVWCILRVCNIFLTFYYYGAIYKNSPFSI